MTVDTEAMPGPEVTPEGGALYREVLLDEELRALRVEFCATVTDQLGSIAGWLGIDSLIGAGDVVDPSSAPAEPDAKRYAAFRGASAVVEMAAELAAAVKYELEAERRYAAASLVRQLIEAEYLLRAFVDDISRAAEWYRASPDDIRKCFMPKTMRPLGGFSDYEYWTHCDQGGHPAPQGARLLRFGVHAPLQEDTVITASMWGDFAQHLGRVWWAVHELLATHHARFATVRAQQIAQVDAIGTRWRDADPLSRPIDFALINEIAAGATNEV